MVVLGRLSIHGEGEGRGPVSGPCGRAYRVWVFDDEAAGVRAWVVLPR